MIDAVRSRRKLGRLAVRGDGLQHRAGEGATGRGGRLVPGRGGEGIEPRDDVGRTPEGRARQVEGQPATRGRRADRLGLPAAEAAGCAEPRRGVVGLRGQPATADDRGPRRAGPPGHDQLAPGHPG